jgi:hypothetical protein
MLYLLYPAFVQDAGEKSREGRKNCKKEKRHERKRGQRKGTPIKIKMKK